MEEACRHFVHKGNVYKTFNNNNNDFIFLAIIFSPIQWESSLLSCQILRLTKKAIHSRMAKCIHSWIEPMCGNSMMAEVIDFINYKVPGIIKGFVHIFQDARDGTNPELQSRHSTTESHTLNRGLCVCVCVHMQVYACRGQRSTSGVFFTILHFSFFQTGSLTKPRTCCSG